MLTIVFLVVFGGLVIGFGVWAVAFGGIKRKGQSSASELEKRPVKENRASGLD